MKEKIKPCGIMDIFAVIEYLIVNKKKSRKAMPKAIMYPISDPLNKQ
jgi:hypothetical protein